MRRSRIRTFCAWARAECRVHVSSRRLRTWLPNPHRRIGHARERPFECCDDRFYTKQGHGWPRWTHKQREHENLALLSSEAAIRDERKKKAYIGHPAPRRCPPCPTKPTPSRPPRMPPPRDSVSAV